MIDIVARVIADGDERTLNFKTNEVIFGGGRLEVKVNEIPLKYSELLKIYNEANIGKSESVEELKTINQFTYYENKTIATASHPARCSGMCERFSR